MIGAHVTAYRTRRPDLFLWPSLVARPVIDQSPRSVVDCGLWPWRAAAVHRTCLGAGLRRDGRPVRQRSDGMAAAPDLQPVCPAGPRLRLKSPVIESRQLPNSARLFRGPHEHGSNRRASCRITQGSRGPSAAEGRPTVVVGASRRSKMPSRPGEFHPEPLTDPDLNLSIHPARVIARRLPPSAEPSGSSRYDPVGPSSTAMTCPLCSTGITPLRHYYEAVRPSPAHRYFRPRGWRRLCLFPLASPARFSRSAQEPD